MCKIETHRAPLRHAQERRGASRRDPFRACGPSDRMMLPRRGMLDPRQRCNSDRWRPRLCDAGQARACRRPPARARPPWRRRRRESASIEHAGRAPRRLGTLRRRTRVGRYRPPRHARVHPVQGNAGDGAGSAGTVREGRATLLRDEGPAGALARMWKFGCHPLQSEPE